MVPAGNWLAFAGIVVLLIAVPGPSVLFTISRALTLGTRSALFTVLGNAVGACLQVVAVAIGLGALVERSVLAFTVVKWVGAAYLVFLGVQAIRHRHAVAAALDAHVAPVGPGRAVLDGVVVGALNPKTIVFFAVALPQFAATGNGDPTAQMLVLGALFPVVAVVLDSAWALGAGTARQWFARSPRRLAAIGGAGGLVMIGLGVRLAVSGRKD
jgi:threonine/homoserine/homoserine lactone efflux protein